VTTTHTHAPEFKLSEADDLSQFLHNICPHCPNQEPSAYCSQQGSKGNRHGRDEGKRVPREDDFRIEVVERPHAGPGEAVIRVTLTTICGTDLHIVRGEYPVQPGLVIGHEPVGVIDELGPESRRLLRQASASLRRLCGRPRRSQDRDHPLPGWKRAHAATHEYGPLGAI